MRYVLLPNKATESELLSGSSSQYLRGPSAANFVAFFHPYAGWRTGLYRQDLEVQPYPRDRLDGSPAVRLLD
jgi:hypothetical protein